jgi:hypothetical protein
MVGGLLICPCHLPLTLGLMATVLSGTAVQEGLTANWPKPATSRRS